MKTSVSEVETARLRYERVRRDSNYRMDSYRTIYFIANMLHRDPFVVLNAVGVERVATDVRSVEDLKL